jgi:uncharacterized protein
MLRISACLLLVVAGGNVMGLERNDVEHNNKSVIEAGFRGWREGTGNVFDLLEPEAKWTIVGNASVSRTYSTRQEFMDAVIKPFNARMSKRLVPHVRNIYADGDTVIALFDAEALARDGKPYRNTYTWYMRMRNSRIVEVVVFFDTIEFMDLWNRVQPQQ